VNEHPPVKGVELVTPKALDKVVVLDRVEPGVTPDYCIHGKTACYSCDEWCWLGDKSFELVRAGDAIGVCLQCATELGARLQGTRVGNVDDHRRADGPH
jgi:hypothetical protein